MKKLSVFIKKQWKKRKCRKMEKIHGEFLNYFIVEMIGFYEDKYNKEPKEFVIGERILAQMIMALPKPYRLPKETMSCGKKEHIKLYGIKVKPSDDFEIRLK